MEKMFAGLSAIVVGWNGFLQKDKVSKSTCKAVHEGLCKKIDSMDNKLNMILEHLIGESK